MTDAMSRCGDAKTRGRGEGVQAPLSDRGIRGEGRRTDRRSIRHIEERLVEAADTLRRLPARLGHRPVFASWPDVVQDARQAYGYTSANARPAPPAPAAIDRMDEAIPWLQLVDRETRKLVWLRVSGVQWWRLTTRLWAFSRHRTPRKLTRQSLHLHYQRGLKEIAAQVALPEGAVRGKAQADVSDR